MSETPRTFIELITTYKETTTLCTAGDAACKIKAEVGLVIVDVSEPAEYDDTSVPGAVVQAGPFHSPLLGFPVRPGARERSRST